MLYNKVQYYAPGLGLGEQLPKDLSRLAQGTSVVSFKGIQEDERCALFSDILERIFETHSEKESDQLSTLIVIDEAQRYTKKRIMHGGQGKNNAARAENLLDLITRESRKFGLNLILVSQSIRDFSHDAATIRSNTNTKAFLGNSDKEVEYASGYLSDGHEIVDLSWGEVIIFNPELGEVRVKVRPPFSKVREMTRDELEAALNHQGQDKSGCSLEPKEIELLRIAKSYYNKTGHYINFTTAAERIGIKNKLKMRSIVEGLDKKGYIKEKKIEGRGSPKIIIPLN